MELAETASGINHLKMNFQTSYITFVARYQWRMQDLILTAVSSLLSKNTDDQSDGLLYDDYPKAIIDAYKKAAILLLIKTYCFRSSNQRNGYCR